MSDNVTFQSSTATPASGTKVASDEATYSGETAQVQLMREVAVSGSEGAKTVVERFATRADTFTGAGNGTQLDLSVRPCKAFALQVKGTGASPGAWSIVLEGSLDGTNYTTMLTHVSGTNSDGAVAWSSAALMPALYVRSRCVSLTLGGATNVVATILGVP